MSTDSRQLALSLATQLCCIGSYKDVVARSDATIYVAGRFASFLDGSSPPPEDDHPQGLAKRAAAA